MSDNNHPHCAIEFEGILRLENNLDLIYYIHNSKKCENHQLTTSLNNWMEIGTPINLTIITDSEELNAVGKVSQHEYNGILEYFVGSTNIGGFLWNNTDNKVRIILRRA